ncbi:hypothetical protein NLI96_g6765 [Meripilus lineatus]|uniref:Uncharacterized protein n=1 Tax=Meripilus lineatus TaxID=2056292 RepID=A0AAD5V0B5_9APHY|nr:hypothetical protein NLI96_g6765 [Physisporinus lineatus]
MGSSALIPQTPRYCLPSDTACLRAGSAIIYAQALNESPTREVGTLRLPSPDLIHHETLRYSLSSGPTPFPQTIVIPMAPETSSSELEARPWSNSDLEDNEDSAGEIGTSTEADDEVS